MMTFLSKILLIILLFSCKEKTDYCVEEISMLGCLIAAECMECDSVERELVGRTVINRVLSPLFPNSIESVITQEMAYHGYCAEWYVYEPQCFEIAKKLVIELNNARSEDPDDAGKGELRADTTVLYFYRKGIKKPKWIKKVTDTMEYHYFGE